jgi:hypothetical protein
LFHRDIFEKLRVTRRLMRGHRTRRLSPSRASTRTESKQPERPIPLPTIRRHEQPRTTEECCQRSDGIALPNIDADRCDRRNRRIRSAHATAGELEKPLIFGIETVSARSRKRKQPLRALATREMLSDHIFGNRRPAIRARANPKPRRSRNGEAV